MNHLSNLMLDRAASGLGDAPAHLAACPECAARVAALRAEADALRGTAGYIRGRARLATSPRARPRLWAWIPALAAAAGVAAAVVGVLDRSPAPPAELTASDPGERIKGDAGVWLEADGDEQPLGTLTLGQTVWLGVRAAGWSHALVIAVDEAGAATEVWPGGATESTRLPRPGGGRLGAAFRVTPGSLALFAFFSDAPLSSSQARSALAAAVEACRGRPGLLGCLAPAPLPGERARARSLFADPNAAR